MRSFALQPENAHTLAKSVDKLLPVLEQPLRDRVLEIRSAVAKAIGCIGAAVIVRPGGSSFIHWALRHLEPAKNKESNKAAFLSALKEVGWQCPQNGNISALH